jgi:hypothetical protein
VKRSTRLGIWTTVATAVIGLGTAIPAQAATHFVSADYGNLCGTRTFYSSMTGDWALDNGSKYKVDFTNLKLGGRADLPSTCASVTKICLETTIEAYVGTNQVFGGSTAPFGAIGASYPQRASVYTGTNPGRFVGERCAAGSGRSASVSTGVMDPANSFLLSDYYKLTKFRISSYVKILVSGTWYSSPTSVYTASL